MSLHFQYRASERKTCEAIPCTIAIIFIFTLVSGIALVICGFMFARPGIPSLEFEETECEVKENRFIEFLPCECGGLQNDSPYCRSHFPCIQVKVTYDIGKHKIRNESNSNLTQIMNRRRDMTSVVYEHESSLYSENKRCSMEVCMEGRKTNTRLVDSFLSKRGKAGLRYPCFYNPEKPEQVILARRYNRNVVILSLALPGCTFVVGFIALFIMCFIARHKKKGMAVPRVPVYRSYMNFGVIGEDGEVIYSGKPAALPGMAQSSVSEQTKVGIVGEMGEVQSAAITPT